MAAVIFENGVHTLIKKTVFGSVYGEFPVLRTTKPSLRTDPEHSIAILVERTHGIVRQSLHGYQDGLQLSGEMEQACMIGVGPHAPIPVLQQTIDLSSQFGDPSQLSILNAIDRPF